MNVVSVSLKYPRDMKLKVHTCDKYRNKLKYRKCLVFLLNGCRNSATMYIGTQC